MIRERENEQRDDREEQKRYKRRERGKVTLLFQGKKVVS